MMADTSVSSTPVLIFVGSVFLSIFVIFKVIDAKKSKYKYPPSIPSIPFLGSIPFMKNLGRLHEEFFEKSKALGNVFSCNISSRFTVVLNDRESIKEAFLNKGAVFSDRGINFVLEHYLPSNLKGIAFRNYSEEYRRLHKLVLNILKDLGMGSKEMELRIQREIEELIPRIREHEEKAFNPTEIISLCVLNVVYRLTFGIKTNQKDSDLRYIYSHIEGMNNNYNRYVHYCPILRFIPYFAKQMEKASFHWKQQTGFHSARAEPCLENGKREACLVETFIKREGPNYDRENLTEITRTLLTGGTESLTVAATWALWLLANHPSLQKRIHDELDSVVPPDRLPSSDDMPMLPLTDATVLEVMRFKPGAPLGLPHNTLNDTEVAGFFIPKDTIVFANFYAVHMSKEEWGDPETFRPERFLDESGGKVIGRDRIMSFSIGKRSCIGEGIGRHELFLLFSSLLQQFDIGIAKDDLSRDVGVKPTSIFNRPEHLQLKFISRQKRKQHLVN